MGTLAEKAGWILFCLLARLCHAEEACPDVKLVDVSGLEKLAVVRGCPALPGAPGSKGDTGPPGMRGEKGSPGIIGKMGPAGEKGSKGETGKPGTTGTKGQPGQPGIIGQPGQPGIIGSKGEPGKPGTTGTKGQPGQPGIIGERELDNINCKRGAKDCKELLRKGIILSGWYAIYPKGCQALSVFCDMDTDGGGWIVFQRRSDDSVDFFREWVVYKKGFGNQLSGFWLGNDNIHTLTSEGTCELRIDLTDFDKEHSFAKYTSFQVLSESENYKIILGEFAGGNAGDSLTRHKGAPFSTKDRDNDRLEWSCAETFKGAWWYTDCHDSNLNGQYLYGEHERHADGINWKSGKGHKYSYKLSEMKLRAVA